MKTTCDLCGKPLEKLDLAFYLGLQGNKGALGEVYHSDCANAPGVSVIDSMASGFLGWQMPPEDLLQPHGLSQEWIQKQIDERKAYLAGKGIR